MGKYLLAVFCVTVFCGVPTATSQDERGPTHKVEQFCDGDIWWFDTEPPKKMFCSHVDKIEITDMHWVGERE